MFADIVGFMRKAGHQALDEVIALLRQFHGRLEGLAFEHQRTLGKFLGDGFMATFGTPNPGSHDTANALRCGREMLADIEKWNTTREEAGAEPIMVFIGLHYGAWCLAILDRNGGTNTRCTVTRSMLPADWKLSQGGSALAWSQMTI
jgi:adenylate cyclase